MYVGNTLVEERPHDCDSFFGRPHVSTGRGPVQRVNIRLLMPIDIQDGLKGRPGSDYRIQYDRDDKGVLTPEQYRRYMLVPRSAVELTLIRLYDWLKSQGVPVISNIERVTNYWAKGVAFGILWGFEPANPSAHLSVGDGPIGERVIELLEAIEIHAKIKQGSGRAFIEFPLRAFEESEVA